MTVRILVVGDVMVDRTWPVDEEDGPGSSQAHGDVRPVKMSRSVTRTDLLGGAGCIARALLANHAGSVHVTLAGVWPTGFEPGNLLDNDEMRKSLTTIQIGHTPFATLKWRLYAKRGDGTHRLFRRFDQDLDKDLVTDRDLSKLHPRDYDVVVVADFQKGVFSGADRPLETVLQQSKILLLRTKERLLPDAVGRPGLTSTLPWTCLLPNLEDLMRPEPPPAGKILRESKGALLVHPTIESKLRGVWETCPNGPETRKIVLKLGREGALLFDPSNKESRLWGLQLEPQSQGDWAGIGAGDNLAAALAAYPLDDSEFRNTLTKAVKFATAYCKNAESIFGHGIGGIRAAVPEAERDEVKVLVRPMTSSPPPSEASSKLRLADARWWIEGFLTVDRELQHEIEGALTAIEGYWNKPGKRPLILAICGGPGSGKSTLARGLAAASKCEYIETNVSQWTSLESLGHMCEQIRDANLRPSRPLIFIDEVDAPLNGDYLYARLLAPLWDGVYLQHGRERPLGSAVFILAGSNDVWKAPDRLRSADDKHTKLKDLVSRITIDPIGIKAFKDRGEDRRYLVANLLRRRFPRLGKIDAGVLESLVNARPLFDIRSMELFIGRSRLSDPQELRPNDLDVALQRWNTFFEERLVLCTAGRWIEIVD